MSAFRDSLSYGEVKESIEVSDDYTLVAQGNVTIRTCLMEFASLIILVLLVQVF